MKSPTKVILVMRLSSLGDVLLSTAFLENIPPGVAVDWVISESFAFALDGHPRIRKLYIYKKSTGIRGWLELVQGLTQQHYDARIDLHGTLRTFIAKLFFRASGQKVISISKERFKTLLYFTLKRFLPQKMRPSHYWQRFSKIGLRVTRSLGIPTPKSDFGNLHPPRFYIDLEPDESNSILSEYQLTPKKYIAVMPASRWKSKEWGSARYFEAIQLWKRRTQSTHTILVLGRNSDSASVQLLEELHRAGIDARSGLDEEEFKVTAYLLQEAAFYFGGDTGLAHLAEACGTPVVTLFGPTQPDVGFGPWRTQSRAIQSKVVCSPCSKDGRPCYRFLQPYECFKQIKPEQVASQLEQIASEVNSIGIISKC